MEKFKIGIECPVCIEPLKSYPITRWEHCRHTMHTKCYESVKNTQCPVCDEVGISIQRNSCKNILFLAVVIAVVLVFTALWAMCLTIICEYWVRTDGVGWCEFHRVRLKVPSYPELVNRGQCKIFASRFRQYVEFVHDPYLQIYWFYLAKNCEKYPTNSIWSDFMESIILLPITINRATCQTKYHESDLLYVTTWHHHMSYMYKSDQYDDDICYADPISSPYGYESRYLYE